MHLKLPLTYYQSGLKLMHFLPANDLGIGMLIKYVFFYPNLNKKYKTKGKRGFKLWL